MTRYDTLETMVAQLKDPIFEPLFNPEKETPNETQEATREILPYVNISTQEPMLSEGNQEVCVKIETKQPMDSSLG